jgi:hypothetical protein
MKTLLAILFALPLAAVATTVETVPPEPLPTGLLVISPKSFEGALKEFVAWKKTLQPTTWVALEEILAEAPGADAPEKLKRWLYQSWKTHRHGYALLVGDVDVLPVRYMVLDRNTAAAFNYAFYPSDLYYADLAKADGSFDDWNAQTDGFHAGYIGEVRGEANKGDPINFDQVDYLPELAVGRWPASTADEVKNIARKSVAWEQKVLAASEPKLRRAAFIAVDGWVDARELLGSLANKLEGTWQIEKRFYGTATPPDTAQVRGILNDGAGLMVHTGHGNPDRWEQCLSIADIDHLTNTTSIPVFVSAGCSTAHFAPLPPYEPYLDREGKFHEGTDRGEKFTEPPLPPAPLQTGKVNPTCLGEALLKRADGGGVAYIGCNTGSQPFGLTLVDGFVRELAAAKTPRLGDCWNSAIRYYVEQQKLRELKPTESWVPPSIFFQGMKFMVFGDPSLRLPGQVAALPAESDLRPALRKLGLTPRAQGGRGTCSVVTVTAAMEYALAQQRTPAQRLSIEYLNWASNQVIGRAADGGFFADLWKGYETWGVCREEDLPYAPAFDPGTKPEAAVIDRAKQQTAGRLRLHWLKPWNVNTGLTATQLAAIRQTLAKGWPVCGGLRWPKREEWQHGVLQMRPAAAVFDGHSVLITGYHEDPAQPGGGTFTFQNPNRPGTECRMTWEYALAYLNDAMWIEAR